MRFLGNKDSIVQNIRAVLYEKGLLDKNLVLFDAFCGTGAVSDYLKSDFNLIINDLLNWCTVYTQARITSNDLSFRTLGFDPIHFLNNSIQRFEGFIYNNYSPAKTERMYFTAENAGRIDYFRYQIEQWKIDNKINNEEYKYLLACLLESVSKVSNTAGVYGAFLKHWDSRALKPIEFIEIESQHSEHKKLTVFHDKVENIIENVECDILYLDPPYTQNQYGTQYHLLETLILDDNPAISKITGSRPTAPMRSDWSKDPKAHILFDKIISKTKARYILFSYSTDGIMSKSFIESSLKRYAVEGTYECRKISYKKYRNFKTKRTNEHFEYLFFIEKKANNLVNYESPLNYIGSKAKMIDDIKSNLPKQYTNFIDVFGGGFNVGINIDCQNIIYNDINDFVVELVKSFNENDTYDYIMYIRRLIKKYNLEAKNKESYLELRNYYNNLPMNKRDPRMIYTIVLYGFNQQIRFNSDLEFNNPVGMRWFNDKVLEKMISFSRAIKEKNVIFSNNSFTELHQYINRDTFFYMDPPYMLTLGSYNDGKRGFEGWTKNHERQMFDLADTINDNGSHFMISYVPEHDGVANVELITWVELHEYNMFEVPPIPGRKRKEVLITNYAPE